MKASFVLSALLSLAVAMPAPAPATSQTISSEQETAMRKVSAFNSIAADVPIGGDEEDGLSGPCKAVTVIFAKGTSEDGNVGDGHSPGPAWFAALRTTLGTDQVTVQGVAYDASVLGYLEGGSPSGSAQFLNTTQVASTKCPSTKLVLGGYSQGGQLLHNAAAKFSSAITSQVAAVVIFGDPDLKDAVGNIPASKVDEICHTGDIICTGSGGAAAHLTYANDAPAAAAFVVARV